eukprot:gene23799-30874_t
MAAGSALSVYGKLLSQLNNVNLRNPVSMGLANMEILDRLMGYPLRDIPVVHITGTNGKGSVALKISECFISCGLRTGLYVSPHLSSYRERIQVNSELLNVNYMEENIPYLMRLCDEHKIRATYFELTTALAFLTYKQSQCDAVVLEVGLGGRDDATNVIKNPSLSIITSIQLDHTKMLGDSVEKIALVKAGIMKPGCPVLVGPGCPMDILKGEALRVGSPFFTLDDLLEPHEKRYASSSGSRKSFNDIDDLNCDISHAAMKLLLQGYPDLRLSSVISSSKKENLTNIISKPLQKRPPCRFEILSRKESVTLSDGTSFTAEIAVVLDIAHNPDAFAALVDKARHLYAGIPIRGNLIVTFTMLRPLCSVVLAMSEDKDLAGCMPSLLRLLDHDISHIHCTEALSPRALSKEKLRDEIARLAAAA